MMNIKILEIAGQAGLHGVNHDSNFDSEDISADRLEKFAQLIVAECVDIANDYVKDCLFEEHIKCNHPRSKIGLKIKEHFRVE